MVTYPTCFSQLLIECSFDRSAIAKSYTAPLYDHIHSQSISDYTNFPELHDPALPRPSLNALDYCQIPEKEKVKDISVASLARFLISRTTPILAYLRNKLRIDVKDDCSDHHHIPNEIAAPMLFLSSIIIALLGALWIIIPMHIMSFQSSKVKGLVTVSTSVTVFAFFLGAIVKASPRKCLSRLQLMLQYLSYLLVLLGLVMHDFRYVEIVSLLEHVKHVMSSTLSLLIDSDEPSKFSSQALFLIYTSRTGVLNLILYKLYQPQQYPSSLQSQISIHFPPEPRILLKNYA